jgi:hypothetical protein
MEDRASDHPPVFPVYLLASTAGKMEGMKFLTDHDERRVLEVQFQKCKLFLQRRGDLACGFQSKCARPRRIKLLSSPTRFGVVLLRR